MNPRPRPIAGAVRGPVRLAAALLLLIHGYLLALVTAAATARRARADSSTTSRLRFVVLIPAHNEEQGLGETLEAVAGMQHDATAPEVIVVSDNSADATAEIARAAGATVWERHDPARAGKGRALGWALERLATERPHTDAVLFLDADCRPSPNLMQAVERRLGSGGAQAVQVSYVVGNPDESWTAALRWAAFALITHLRPLGKSRLGLSCGLLGTGMAIRFSVLQRLPWAAFSLAEDREFHFELVKAGKRVVFEPGASVVSDMPTSLSAARSQHLRWEAGQQRTARAHVGRLLGDGLRQRNIHRIHVGLESLLPSQSVLLVANAVTTAVAFWLGSATERRLAAAAAVSQVVYVVGGMAVVRAPRSVWRALALAPVLALWKIGLHGSMLLGRGPREWTRTARSPSIS